MRQPFSFVILAAVALSGCQSTSPGTLNSDMDPGRFTAVAPPGAPPGTCWGKEVTPAIVETVTEQIILQPAEIGSDGTILRPAVYKTETRQAIVREREERWFQTPCPDVQTQEFVASLQRALLARGLYRGTITGVPDKRTRNAIRRYQKPLGLDSEVLSLSSARALGLVALEREDLEN